MGAMKFVSDHVNELRKRFLGYQFEGFLRDDRLCISSAYEKDTRDWRELCERSLKGLEERRDSLSPHVKMFMSEFRAVMRGLDTPRTFVMGPFGRTKPPRNDSSTNHVKLFHLNRRIARVRQNIGKIRKAIVKVHPIAMEFMNRALRIVNDHLKTIADVAASAREFVRLGFPSSSWTALVENNQAKERVLRVTKGELERQIKVCEDLFRLVQQTIHRLAL
jgi:hypothetical protein